MIVSAQELIALETAMRDLARLYESALVFAALRPRAEAELLPRMNDLGSFIRGRLRAQSFDARVLQSTAEELHRLSDMWQKAIDAMRDTPEFRDAVAAFDRDDQTRLRSLLPQVFAGLVSRDFDPPTLYYALSLAAPRRRPGARPFVNAADAAARIARCQTGIEPDAGDAWWETALRHVTLAEDCELLDAPVALAFDLRSTNYALLSAAGEPTLRIYTPSLRAPFRVVIDREPHDDWWEAATEPYAVFRDELCALLGQHGIAATVVA